MKKHIRRRRGRLAQELAQDIKAKYWMPLEDKHKSGAWEALDSGYAEDHRAYHTWEHLAGLFERLSEFSRLSARPDVVAVAIFWHDAVYRTRDLDGSPRPNCENVRDSAELFLHYTLLDGADAGAVHDLIMATANHPHAKAEKQHYAGFAGDLDLFLDLDLSALSLPWEEFAKDFARIRAEFTGMPEAEFCIRQIRLLESFAQGTGSLYRRAETSAKWHAGASANIERCLAGLRRRIAELSGIM